MRNLTNIVLGSYLAIAGCNGICRNEEEVKSIRIKPGKYLTRAPDIQNLDKKIEAKFSTELPRDSQPIRDIRPYEMDAIVEITEEGKIFVYPRHLEE